MASKFAVIVINEYLTVAAVVLPIVITFGVLAKGGVGYWVNAALVYLALPVIPLAVVSLLVVVMMRFINVSRKKDALILIGSILLIVMALGVQIAAGEVGGERGAGGERRGRRGVLHVARQPPQPGRGVLPAGDLGDEGRGGGIHRRGAGVSGASVGRLDRAFRGHGLSGREAVLPGARGAGRDDGEEAAADAGRNVAARLVGAAGRRGGLLARVEDHEPDADLPAERDARRRPFPGHLRV